MDRKIYILEHITKVCEDLLRRGCRRPTSATEIMVMAV